MATGDKLNRYKEMLIDLLPPGKLWDTKNQPELDRLLATTAIEFCRVDDRAEDALREIDPRATFELLEDWERLLGLPDECTPDGPSLDERREQILAKYTNVGGISAAFYEALILQLGFVATVTNPVPFEVGKSRVGDALTNDFEVPFLVGTNAVGDSLFNVGWLYYFNVDLPATAVTFFEVGNSTVGEPLADFSNPLIECTIRRLKPAHTGVTFTFSS